MNSRQLQYAILLSQMLNFSQVADKLNISQPALSKQILSLEQELGIKLFDRSTVPLTLTPAGESFINDAKELLFKEEQLLRSMEEFKSGEKARIKIGVSPFRCLYLMPEIVAKLRKEFPGLQVSLIEDNSTNLHKYACDGELDFAIINLPVDEALLDISLLKPEKLILAVPNKFKNLLPDIKTDNNSVYPEIDLSVCQKLPFIVLSNNQELRRLFDKLCLTSNLKADIVSEVVGITTAWAMAKAGVGATVLPLQFLENSLLDGDLSFYVINHESSVRQPAIVTRKGQFVSKYAKYAMNLLGNL